LLSAHCAATCSVSTQELQFRDDRPKFCGDWIRTAIKEQLDPSSFSARMRVRRQHNRGTLHYRLATQTARHEHAIQGRATLLGNPRSLFPSSSMSVFCESNSVAEDDDEIDAMIFLAKRGDEAQDQCPRVLSQCACRRDTAAKWTSEVWNDRNLVNEQSCDMRVIFEIQIQLYTKSYSND
jgi:hypothetical protein